MSTTKDDGRVRREEFEPFDMTSDGFRAAKKWLQMMDLFEDYIDGAADTSGFGVVSYANAEFTKMEANKNANG